MKDLLEFNKKIERYTLITSSIYILLFYIVIIFNKYYVINKYFLFGFIFIFIPFSLSIITYTIQESIKAFKSNNFYLLAILSCTTSMACILSGSNTSKLIYEALGYKPMYAPYTVLFINYFSMLFFLFLLLTMLGMLALGLKAIASFIINITPSLYNKDKRMGYLISGIFSIFIYFIFALSFIEKRIDTNQLIQNIALGLDYYPIKKSSNICVEAKLYDGFNYLSDGYISLYKHSKFKNLSYFSIIKCEAH